MTQRLSLNYYSIGQEWWRQRLQYKRRTKKKREQKRKGDFEVEKLCLNYVTALLIGLKFYHRLLMHKTMPECRTSMLMMKLKEVRT